MPESRPESRPEAQPVPAIRPCRHGCFMYPRGDRYVGRSLELYGEYSEDEVRLFTQLVPENGTVVEVGANIGSLTVPLARMVGPRGRVVALEPQRAVFNILCGNLALNGLLQVEALRVAGGRAAGRMDIAVHDYDERENFGGVGLGTPSSGPVETVSVVAVDSLGLRRLDLLKIDVEGFEAEVVAGATAAIGRFRPALFVENDRRERSPELIRHLLDLDYRLWWHLSPLYRPDNFRGNPQNVLGNLISINMLALPQENSRTVSGLRPVSGPDDWWRA